MNFIKNLATEQSEKTTLLQSVKTLASNLNSLKNVLGKAFSQEKTNQSIEKLASIWSKQTIIMNKIRQGVEKQTPTPSIKNSRLIPQKKQQDAEQLKQVFKQQRELEEKRTLYLSTINANLQSLFSSVNGNTVTSQENKNGNDIQFDELIEALKIDRGSKKLQKWAGNLYVNTMTQSYQQHIKGNKSFDDTKMEMSFVILTNYRRFVLKLYEIGFSLSDREKLEDRFEKAGSKAVEYLVTKCPMSKQTFDISIFEKLGNRSNQSKHPNYDLLHELNIEFDTSSSSLGPTLKQFIGKLTVQVNRFYPTFKHFIHKIADGADSADTKNRLTYDVDRKINQGATPYNEQEVKTPGFFTKSTELMRTLTKWVQFLINPFEHPEKVVQNFILFRSPQGIERLNHKQRLYMAEKFQKRKEKLRFILKSMNLYLTRTISSIIVISDNPIGSNRIESFPFLDSSASNLLLVCRFVWKTIEGFANEIIRQILKLYDEISQEYQNQNRRESSFNLYGFFIQDLITCDFKGSKDAILFIFNNLLKEQQENTIKILQVSNNLQKPSQNIIVLFKHKQSILTFEIAFHLTGKKGDEKDEFNRFLRQLEKTILTPTFMLASNLINLNPVKQYLKKYKPYFKPSVTPFSYNSQNNTIVCKEHPQSSMKQGVTYNSFICNVCFLFIESYSHYFSKEYCTTCFLNICFPCKLSMLPESQKISYLFHPVQKLKEYFTPFEVYQYLETKVIKEKISKYLRDNLESGYLLVVSYQNSTNEITMWLLKSMIHQDEELILTNFKNDIFDFQKLDKSIILLLKPSSPLLYSPDDNAKYQTLYTLQNNWTQPQQDDEQYIQLKGKSLNRIIIDYQINKPTLIRELISRTAIERIIANQNKSKEGKLLFNKLIIDFNFLKKLKSPESILVLDLNECELDSRNLSELNIFTSLQEIFISNTPSFAYNKFQFDDTIVSINITQCELTSFQFEFHRLKELRLIRNKLSSIVFKNIPKLHTLKLCQNQLPSFYNLATSSFPNLIKLDFKCNNINEPLPILSFQKLKFLQLSQNELSNISSLEQCQLPNLKQLYLNNNKVETLPSLKRLQNLQILKITHNQLRVINGFEHQNLRLLDLSYNRIQDLPLFNYLKLEQLHIQYNQISNFTTLKQSFLNNLRLLDVQYNPIEKGKLPLLSNIDRMKVHPDGIEFTIEANTPCKPNEKTVCQKCQKEIKIVEFYQKVHERLCKNCYHASENKNQYKEVYILDRNIMSKYA